jgi:hypothetical protein
VTLALSSCPRYLFCPALMRVTLVLPYLYYIYSVRLLCG